MKLNYNIIDAIDSVCIYWKDLEGRIMGCNRYLYEFAGLARRSDVIGKTDFELPWKSEALKIREMDEAVVRENRCYQMEEKVILDNGSAVTFLSSKTPLVENNRIIGIVGISIDITKTKHLEMQLAQKEWELNTFLKFKEELFS